MKCLKIIADSHWLPRIPKLWVSVFTFDSNIVMCVGSIGICSLFNQIIIGQVNYATNASPEMSLLKIKYIWSNMTSHL